MRRPLSWVAWRLPWIRPEQLLVALALYLQVEADHYKRPSDRWRSKRLPRLPKLLQVNLVARRSVLWLPHLMPLSHTEDFTCLHYLCGGDAFVHAIDKEAHSQGNKQAVKGSRVFLQECLESPSACGTQPHLSTSALMTTEELREHIEHFFKPAMWGPMGDSEAKSLYPEDVQNAIIDAEQEKSLPDSWRSMRCRSCSHRSCY